MWQGQCYPQFMKYLYWFIAGMVVALGVGFSIYMSSEPLVVSKLSYSHFQTPSEFAEKLVVTLEPELKGATLIMLGVIPGRTMDLEVWKAFLEQAEKRGFSFQAVVIDPELPRAQEYFPQALPLDIKSELGRFMEGAKNARSQNIRMAVIVPSIYASQSLRENPADLINKKSDLRPLSFSLVGFPRSPAEEPSMEFPCVMGANDRLGTGPLGCLTLQKARLVYNHKPPSNGYEGMVDMVRERDYLLFLNGR